MTLDNIMCQLLRVLTVLFSSLVIALLHFGVKLGNYSILLISSFITFDFESSIKTGL